MVVIWYPQKKNFSKKTSSEFSSMRSNLMIKSSDFVVSFRDEVCQIEEIVGGKGSSLALLTSIQTDQVRIFN